MIEEDNFALDEPSVYDYIIINHEGYFYRSWRVLYVISCLFSSYLYGFMTIYERPLDRSYLNVLTISFESIFLITVVI